MRPSAEVRVEGVRSREKLPIGHSTEREPTVERKECPAPWRPHLWLEAVVLHWQEFLRGLYTLGVGNRHKQMEWTGFRCKRRAKRLSQGQWQDQVTRWATESKAGRRMHMRSENRCSQLLLTERRGRREKMISDGIISEQEQFHVS